MRNYTITLLGYLLATPLLAAASAPSFNLTQVATGIYVHLGKHVGIEHSEHDDIANIGFIIGERCIAVIDTGGSIAIGKQLLTAIRTISPKPICYVINTHIHFDHVLGNLAFINEQPVFIGHHQLGAAMEQNREFFLTQFGGNINNDPSAIIAPTQLVETIADLDLGGRILTLTAYPSAHSHNDLTVLDKQTNTLWAGDLIFRERIPAVTGSLKGWLQVMQQLDGIAVTKVIPGHGSIADSMAEAIADQHGYLHKLFTETKKAIAKGQFIGEVTETIDKENEFGWLLHELQHPANISKTFIELEWD